MWPLIIRGFQSALLSDRAWNCPCNTAPDAPCACRDPYDIEIDRRSARPLFSCSGRAYRQRVILIIHLRFNTISLLDFSGHLGRVIRMQTDFLAALLLDEIVPV